MKNTKDKFTNGILTERMCPFDIIEALIDFYDKQYRLGGRRNEGYKRF